MGARNTAKARRMYQIILENPGISKSWLCHLIGYRNQVADGLLAALEQQETLVYEDDAGRLYPFHMEELDEPWPPANAVGHQSNT